MKRSYGVTVGSLIAVAAMFLGCGGGTRSTAVQPAVEPAAVVRLPAGQLPQTLAIFPFENNSVTDSQQMEPLSKGLEALDQGKKAEARRLFEACIARDPAYKAQIDGLRGLD